MGDPIRLTIPMCLASEELRVKDLCDLLGGSQANVSGHLKRLVAVGLVSGRREGRGIHYHMADPRVRAVVATVTAMATAAYDGEPEDLPTRPPTPVLDLLREHSGAIMSFRKALDGIDFRGPRQRAPAGRRPGPRLSE
jgi:DNA-binding transcriptional ArsR family regulator